MTVRKALCGLLIALMIAGCGAEKVENKEMSINLASGTRTGLYTGEIKEGKPSGQGTFKTKNSKGVEYTYNGGFKDGTFDGKATLTFADGRKQEETYAKGTRQGAMKLFKNNILLFEGSFVNGVIEGPAKEYYDDGKIRYDGEYKNGVRCGKGKLYKKDGTVLYEGEFADNLPSLPPVKLNQTVSFADWEYSASGVKSFNTIGNTPASGSYFMVLINAKNNSSFARQIGSDFFVLTDSKGRVFKASLKASTDYQLAANLGGTWALTEVNPGNTISNVPIIFDIPKDAKGLKLIPNNGIGKVAPILLQ